MDFPTVLLLSGYALILFSMFLRFFIPSSLVALVVVFSFQFEWAWQHPSRSRRLGSAVAKRHHKETNVQYKVRVLSVMLSVGPWSRLGLTVRWLKQEYQIPFPVGKEPPIHMPIAYGLIELSKEGCSNGNKFSDGTTADAKKVPECDICSLQPLVCQSGESSFSFTCVNEGN